MFIGFDKIITNWYLINKRNLPWRDTNDPYTIWLSEIILQQTRVEQGLPYFNNFINKYPTVSDLANASEEAILRDWQGLGYYSRARNMHATAKFIQQNLNANFPTNHKELLQLKGIGKYTAAAIASFSTNQKIAVVDGNVFRVLSRFLGLFIDISSSSAYKKFEEASLSLMENSSPNLYNQAIMEFGALQCTPQKPKCDNCPLIENCVAFKNKQIEALPVKTKKTKTRERYFNYYIFFNENHQVFLHKRTRKDIWQNLYEFHLIETNSLDETKTIELPFKEYNTVYTSKELVHKLSHQNLHIQFNYAKINIKNMDFYDLEDAKKLPKPIIIAEALDQFIQYLEKD